MEHIPALIGGGLFLMGSSFFGVSVFLMIRKLIRTKNWTKTTGVVINVERSLGMQQPMGTTRNTLFKPKVRFQTAEGRVIDYEPTTSNSWSNYRVGEQIPVFYHPQQPGKVMFGASSWDWLRFSVFAVVGGGLALFGAVFLLIGLFSKF